MKKVKILLGGEKEGLDDCDMILSFSNYKIVDIRECLQKALMKEFGFDKCMVTAYAQRVIDSFSDSDLRTYLSKAFKTFPDHAILHTDDAHFAKIAKMVMHADLARIAMYGVNYRIPLEDADYDVVLTNPVELKKIEV